MEIERKYLLINTDWKKCINDSKPIIQGYMQKGSGSSVRIRIEGENACLTIKGPRTGISRDEFEYSIPIEDAQILLEKYCNKPFISKVRHSVNYKGHVWQIDEFREENLGLVLAEIELSEEGELFEKPDWIGEEVSTDNRYFNSNLVRNPYSEWNK